MSEESNRPAMFAIIAANLVVIVVMVIAVLARGGLSFVKFGDFLIAVVLAIVAAAGTFGAAKVLEL